MNRIRFLDLTELLTLDVKLGLVKFQLSLLMAQFFFQEFVLQRKSCLFSKR